MPATPQSEALNSVNIEFARLITKYQMAAVEADKPGQEEVFLHVCDRMTDALHAARKAVRLLESTSGQI